MLLEKFTHEICNRLESNISGSSWISSRWLLITYNYRHSFESFCTALKYSNQIKSNGLLGIAALMLDYNNIEVMCLQLTALRGVSLWQAELTEALVLTKSDGADLLGGVYGTTLMLLSVDTLIVLQQSIVGTKPSTFISCRHTHTDNALYTQILIWPKALRPTSQPFRPKSRIWHWDQCQGLTSPVYTKHMTIK